MSSLDFDGIIGTPSFNTSTSSEFIICAALSSSEDADRHGLPREHSETRGMKHTNPFQIGLPERFRLAVAPRPPRPLSAPGREATCMHNGIIGSDGNTASRHALDDTSLHDTEHGSYSTSTCAATTALLRGTGYYVTDENATDAGGELNMDPCSGKLSVTYKGVVFIKVHRRWIVNVSGEKIGECFSLRSSTNNNLYLALNTDSSDYSVQGMTPKDMGDISNSYWRYVPFKEIGKSPPKSHYFALQYWGNYFGAPNSTSYYFVIENKVIFKLASADIAAHHGCLGIKQSS